jgi:hypothetical protein
VGEALFFRSIFYFNKVRQFGDVPWYDGPLNPDDEILRKPRDRRDMVVENMLVDLDRAISYLPSRGVNANWTGRVNKETAMMLQARIALYEGTWQKYHAGTPFGVLGSDGNKYLTKAAQVTDALIALGTCGLDNVSLENGYHNLFNQESYRGSKEVVFWREYNLSLGLGNWWSAYTTFGNLSGFTKRMVDMYLMTDGSPIYDHPLYQGDNTLLDIVVNRDPRMVQTLAVNNGQQIQFPPDIPFQYPNFENNDRGGTTGYQVIKHHIPRANLSGASGSQAMIYFRYAEALLINAEAKAELGTITQQDLDRTVNQLRRRLVGMADMNLIAVNALPAPTRQFPNLSNIINEVRRERTVELAAEGFRVDDIFRWAAADILIRGYVPQGAKLSQWTGTLDPAPPVGFVGAVEGLIADVYGYILPYARQAFPPTGFNFNLGRDYLRPLPSEELRLFPNLQPQNPGWQ